MSQSLASQSIAPSGGISTWANVTVQSQAPLENTFQKSDYLRNAYYYLSHRRSLLSLWQNLSYQETAFDETVATDTIASFDKVSPTGDSLYRDREYLQYDLSGNVTNNLGELYEHAEFIKPLFFNSLKQIASDVNLTVRDPNSTVDVTAESGLILCPLKSIDRATEKIREKYSKVDPGPSCCWIYDILRAAFVCDTEEQIRNVYDLICNDSNFQIIRVKNRFRTPTTAGFRDILVNVLIEDIGPSGRPTHFVCEIQITHIDLWQYEIENDTRSLLKYFRQLASGTTINQDVKIKILEKIVAITSPILNATVDNENIDMEITEAIRKISDEALMTDNIDVLNNWVETLECVSELELSEKFQRKLIKIQIKKYGDKNFIVADSLLKLGNILRGQNNLEQAALVYQAAAVMKNELLGEVDPQVADALFCMAEVRALQQKYDAAVPLHEQVSLMYSDSLFVLILSCRFCLLEGNCILVEIKAMLPYH
jgi:tetratricopeptide (TPR) repeat protein